MKIAFVYDAVYPYHPGGKEKRLFEIVRRLSHNHEIHIYCMKWWEGSDNFIRENIYYYAIAKNVPLYDNKNRRSIWQGIYFGLNCLKLIKEDFDLVDVDHMPFCQLFSIKLVCLL